MCPKFKKNSAPRKTGEYTRHVCFSETNATENSLRIRSRWPISDGFKKMTNRSYPFPARTVSSIFVSSTGASGNLPPGQRAAARADHVGYQKDRASRLAWYLLPAVKRATGSVPIQRPCRSVPFDSMTGIWFAYATDASSR